MVKKVTKKKNRRLRRQIRKTVGCLLMASAVFVAALPVPEISARNDQKVERVAVVNHTSSTDLTQYEKIDGRELRFPAEDSHEGKHSVPERICGYGRMPV